MTKSTSQARIKPEILSTLGPNPTQKTRPDLQLCSNECMNTANETQ